MKLDRIPLGKWISVLLTIHSKKILPQVVQMIFVAVHVNFCSNWKGNKIPVTSSSDSDKQGSILSLVGDEINFITFVRLLSSGKQFSSWHEISHLRNHLVSII